MHVQISTSDNLDFAWLQHHLLQDQLRMQALVQAGFHSSDANRVLQLRAHTTPVGASLRVNLTGSACFWLNDVETDPAYKCVHALRLDP